jgi:serine phosphatase RsbU (regulator of sigma subunit)
MIFSGRGKSSTFRCLKPQRLFQHPLTPMPSRSPTPRTRENVLLLVIGLVGAGVFWLLFPQVQPMAHLGLRLDRGQAWQVADAAVREAGLSPERYTQRNMRLTVRGSLLSFYQARDIPPDTQAHIETFGPLAFWDVVYVHPETREQVLVQVSRMGEVFRLERRLPDDVQGAALSLAQAQVLAEVFLQDSLGLRLADYALVNAESQQQPRRIDHTLVWEQALPDSLTARLTMVVQGDRIGTWSKWVDLPEAFHTRSAARMGTSDLFPFWQVILALVVFIVALIVFAVRFRASEIGVRNGLVVALVTLLILVAYFSLILPFIRHDGLADPNPFTQISRMAGIGLNTLFITLMLFCVWNSGESISREVWPEKLQSLDGLFARRFFFPSLGRDLLHGLSGGFATLGTWYMLALVFRQLPDVWAIPSQGELFTLSAYTPVGINALQASLGALQGTAYAFLFMLPFLKRRLRNTGLAVLLTLIPFGFLFSETTILLDRWAGGLVSILSGIVTYSFALRYSLLASFVMQMVAGMLPLSLMLLYQPNVYFQVAGGLDLAFVLGLLAYGYLARTRGVALDEQAVQPAYTRFITERERLKLELDIARKAQLRMLPQHIPQTKGLDIAAFCEPAREVGGDYFDFFRFDERRLGIAVGDVSGKGMPAALYMTMLKGFLQSKADETVSPRDILIHVNRKFRQSADPGTFVTLLFGVIDLEQGLFTFARAGHNPVVIYRADDQSLYLLQPPGLGIGLESGRVFDRIIREETFALQPGDTILLYTDGLTEARNPQGEEFGEDRVREFVRTGADGNAEQALHALRHAFDSFVGNAEPHDDLTCMVVKVV